MGAGARRPQPTSLGGGQGAYGRQSSRFRGRRYSFGGGPHPPGMGSAVPRPPGAAFGVTVGGHKGQDVSKGRGRATTRVNTSHLSQRGKKKKTRKLPSGILPESQKKKARSF